MDDQPITRVFNALPILAGDFIMTEPREAIKSTQGNKATGQDDIPVEVWKLERFNDNYLKWLTEAILPFPNK